jgi:transcriptional regulator GlxA family with amidase domain
MFLLRETDRSVTDFCLDVGFTSLGTFSRTFARSWGRRRRPTAAPRPPSTRRAA